MNRREFVAGAAIVALGLGTGVDAKRKRRGRVRGESAGDGLHWDVDHIDVRVVGSQALMEALIDGFQRWRPNDAPPLAIALGGPGPVRRGEVKVWEATLPGQTVGQVETTQRNGIILKATLVLDPWNWQVPGQMAAVAAHELGHIWGLGHRDDPDSIMAPEGGSEYPSSGDIRRLNARYQ